MPRKLRTFAEEREYSSLTMPPIERRCLMESGMRRPTTRMDVLVVVAFLLGLAVVLAYFLVPVVGTLVRHIPDLFSSYK